MSQNLETDCSKVLGTIDLNNLASNTEDLNQFVGCGSQNNNNDGSYGNHHCRLSVNHRSSILKLGEAVAFERRSSTRRVSWAQTFQYKEVLPDGTTVLTSQELNKYAPIVDLNSATPTTVINSEPNENRNDPKNNQDVNNATLSEKNEENTETVEDENILKIKNKFGQQHLPQVLSKYYNPKDDRKDYATVINTALNKYGVEIDTNNPTNNLNKLFDLFKRENPSQEQNFTTFLKHFNLNDDLISDDKEQQQTFKNHQPKEKTETSNNHKAIDSSSNKNFLNYTTINSDEIDTTSRIRFNSTKISDDHSSLNLSIIDQSPIRKISDLLDVEFDDEDKVDCPKLELQKEPLEIIKTIHDTTFMRFSTEDEFQKDENSQESKKSKLVNPVNFLANLEDNAQQDSIYDMSLELSMEISPASFIPDMPLQPKSAIQMAIDVELSSDTSSMETSITQTKNNAEEFLKNLQQQQLPEDFSINFDDSREDNPTKLDRDTSADLFPGSCVNLFASTSTTTTKKSKDLDGNGLQISKFTIPLETDSIPTLVEVSETNNQQLLLTANLSEISKDSLDDDKDCRNDESELTKPNSNNFLAQLRQQQSKQNVSIDEELSSFENLRNKPEEDFQKSNQEPERSDIEIPRNLSVSTFTLDDKSNHVKLILEQSKTSQQITFSSTTATNVFSESMQTEKSSKVTENLASFSLTKTTNTKEIFQETSKTMFDESEKCIMENFTSILSKDVSDISFNDQEQSKDEKKIQDSGIDEKEEKVESTTNKVMVEFSETLETTKPHFDMKPREIIETILNTDNDDDDSTTTLNLTEKFQTDEDIASVFITDMDYSRIDHANFQSDLDKSMDDIQVDVIQITREQLLNNETKLVYVPTKPLDLGKSATEILYQEKCLQQQNEKMTNDNQEQERKNTSGDQNPSTNDDPIEAQQPQQQLSTVIEEVATEQPQTIFNTTCLTSIYSDLFSNVGNLKRQNLDLLRPPLKMMRFDPASVASTSHHQEQQPITGSTVSQIISEMSALKSAISLQMSSKIIGSSSSTNHSFIPTSNDEKFQQKPLKSVNLQPSSRIVRNQLPLTSSFSFRIPLAPALKTKPKMDFLHDDTKTQSTKMNDEQIDANQTTFDDSMTLFFETNTTKNHIRKSLGLTLRERLLEKINKQHLQQQQQEEKQKIFQDDSSKKSEEEVKLDIDPVLTESDVEKIPESNKVSLNATTESINDREKVEDDRILSPIEMEQSMVKMLTLDEEVVVDDVAVEQQQQQSEYHLGEISDKIEDYTLNITGNVTENFSMMIHDLSCMMNDSDPIQNLEYSLYGRLTGTIEKTKISPELTMFDFINKLDHRQLNVRIQFVSQNLLVLRYLLSTLELRIHFGSIVNQMFLQRSRDDQDRQNSTQVAGQQQVREIVAMDLISLIDSNKPLPHHVMRGQEDEPLYDGDFFLLSFTNQEHRQLLHLAHDYVLTHFEEKRSFFDKTFKDTTKLEQLIKEFSILVIPAKKMATELRVLLSSEIMHLLPRNQEGRFGISVEILALRKPINLHLTFDHLKYPDEVIHPNIILPDDDRHLYPLEEFSAALKMIKPCSYNYITNLIKGARYFILALRKVMKQNKLHQKQTEEIRAMARFELQRSD